MLFLSIDFGTSAVKISIIDENGSIQCRAKHEYHYLLLPDEKVELSPDSLLSALFSAAKQLNPDLLKKVDYLCYDTFSPSLVLMNNNGELVYPNIITHLDRRCRAQSDFICNTIGKDAYLQISGIYPFAGGCSAMMLLWFQQNENYYLDKTEKIGHLTTYLHKLFTGNWMIDLVNASMLGLYETTLQNSWSQELLAQFHFPSSWFSDIYPPGMLLGALLPDIAKKLGVPAGIPVAVGTNDVAAAQMGAGNNTAGQIMNTAGSSEMVSILTDKPVTNPHYYLRNAALPGLWQIYATTAGGFALDWFYLQFCHEMKRDDFYQKYLMDSIKKYGTTTTITFDPYLTGDRQSLQKKAGAWHGLSLASTREEMLAAMLKSIQKVLHTTLLEAKQFLTLDKTIKISGGMVTPAYLQMKKMEMPEFSFKQVDDCPLHGNVELIKYHNYESVSI